MHDQTAAGKAFSEVIIGIAFQLQRDAGRHEGAVRLAAAADGADAAGIIRQNAIARSHMRTEQCAE